MSLFIIVIGLVIAAVILYFTWRNLNESDNKVNGNNIVNGSSESSNGNESNIVNGSNRSSNGSTSGTIQINNNIEDTESVNPVTPSDNQLSSLPSFMSADLLSSNPPVISLNELPGSTIIASSYRSNFPPENVKINSNSFWRSQHHDYESWIQFSYPSNYEVLAIHIKWDTFVIDSFSVRVSFLNVDYDYWYKEETLIINGDGEFYHEFSPGIPSKGVEVMILDAFRKQLGLSPYSIPMKVGIYGRELK
jgi:hypothetical protein